MKIGIEAQRIFRKKKHGMDVVVLELIKQLQKMDSPHEFIVFVKNGPDDQCIRPSRNLKIVKVPGKSYPDWEQIFLPRAAKKHGVDLLHLTSNTAPINVGIPYIITLHDIIFLEKVSFDGTMYQNFGNLYRRWNIPRVVDKAHSIITVSEFERGNILTHLSSLEGKVHAVHNGVNPIFKTQSTQDKRVQQILHQYQLPSAYMFFLGNKAPKKNMPRVLKAYGSYVERVSYPLPLVMAETTQDELMKMLDELNLSHILSNIRLTGYIEHKYLPIFYSQSSFFLYPSLRESFGLPIIEAMACGTPVITSSSSAMPEIAGDAAILVDPTSQKHITDAMVLLHQDEQLRDRLIEAGLRRAPSFGWDKHAGKVLKLYHEALSQESISPLEEEETIKGQRTN
ncbi:MAG: glycosyltransferase family 1 protein [Bacteroidota bacterium]